MSTELHDLTLLDAARLLRRRAVSAEELCRASLERIDRLDVRLHSVLHRMPDEALAQARQADREIAAGDWRGPLHGVPLGIKDLLDIAGQPTTAGLAPKRATRPGRDATAVARLRTAGAVFVGKLHMTEGATKEHHPAYPRPENPWRAGHWPGVSSSGSGVAVAARLCYGALGSDTGGSIRMPSAACGITGIKPTWGRVSRHGVYPLAETFDHIGPMARTAADAAAILEAIAGPDPLDLTASLQPAPRNLGRLGRGVRGLTIGVDWTYATAGVTPAVRDAFAAALPILQALGASVREIAFPPTPVAEIMPLMSVQTRSVHAEAFAADPEAFGPDLRRMLETQAEITADQVARAMLARLRFKGALEAVFQDVDLIATPTMVRSAPTWPEVEALSQEETLALLTPFTLPFDITGHPTISVPCGFDDLGLPLSLQLIGRDFEEAVLCRAGRAFQGATDFHRRSPALT